MKNKLKLIALTLIIQCFGIMFFSQNSNAGVACEVKTSARSPLVAWYNQIIEFGALQIRVNGYQNARSEDACYYLSLKAPGFREDLTLCNHRSARYQICGQEVTLAVNEWDRLTVSAF